MEQQNNQISLRGDMPPAHAAVLQSLKKHPEQYFDSLVTLTPTSMIKAETPNLWQLRQLMGEIKTKAVVIYALAWLSELVNIERNLTEVQVSEIAADVIEEYGYLKVEEVKYILKTAVRENKLFGRLDYAVVMKWFEDYSSVRTGHCIEISDQEATQQANQMVISSDAVSFNDYLASLRDKAGNGDKNAKEMLDEIERMSQMPKLLSADEKHQNELEFFKWRTLIYNRE